MKAAQYLDETPGQVITNLICESIQVDSFAQINGGVIKSGVSLKLCHYNLEGLLIGLLDDHGAEKLIKRITELYTSEEEMNDKLKIIKEKLNP